MTETTIFQKIINEEIPCDKLYEDKFCIAFNDIQAQAPVHFLVIPKKPIVSLLECTEEDSNLLGHLLFVGSKIAKLKNLTNWRTVINTGAESGQTVFHLHILLPTKSKCPNKFESSSIQSIRLMIGFFGITKKCTGACAWISLNAIQNSSS